MSSVIYRKTGDTARAWTATLYENGSPINLDSANVVMKIKDSDGNVVVRAMTVTDAAGGAVSYQPVAEDVAKAGKYLIELQVTYADTTEETSPTIDTHILYIKNTLS
jgi:hypothetical protein